MPDTKIIVTESGNPYGYWLTFLNIIDLIISEKQKPFQSGRVNFQNEMVY